MIAQTMIDGAPADGPAESSPGGDPRLDRLRTLLRMQLQAADTGTWAAFHALAAAVRDELDRRGGGPADEAAVAEVAHLQLRLELLLRQRVVGSASRLRRLAAQRTYLSMTGATRPR